MTEEQKETLETQQAVLLAFLDWLKTQHRAELWTPDPWADCGMSPDSVPGEARVQEFLGLPCPWRAAFDARIAAGLARDVTKENA